MKQPLDDTWWDPRWDAGCQHMYAYVVKIKFFLINTDTGHRAKETDLFFGIDHSRLFLALQHKLLCVLKAILLEAKVLVQSSASACSLERSMISECSTCSTVKCFWHSLDALDLQLRWASFRKASGSPASDIRLRWSQRALSSAVVPSWRSCRCCRGVFGWASTQMASANDISSHLAWRMEGLCSCAFWLQAGLPYCSICSLQDACRLFLADLFLKLWNNQLETEF